MVAQLRPTFVVDTRSDPTAEGGTVPALVSLVDVLQLKVPATSADAAAALVTVRGSVLAALSNAGLDNTQVLHELCRAGAVATLLKLLQIRTQPILTLALCVAGMLEDTRLCRVPHGGCYHTSCRAHSMHPYTCA